LRRLQHGVPTENSHLAAVLGRPLHVTRYFALLMPPDAGL
jgi:hypothetical protein